MDVLNTTLDVDVDRLDLRHAGASTAFSTGALARARVSFSRSRVCCGSGVAGVSGLLSGVAVRLAVVSRRRVVGLAVIRYFLLAVGAVATTLAFLGAVLRVGLVAAAVGELAITILSGHDLLDLRGSLAHVRDLLEVPVLNVLLQGGSFLRGVSRFGETVLVVIAAKDEDLFPGDVGDGPGVRLGVILAPDGSALVVQVGEMRVLCVLHTWRDYEKLLQCQHQRQAKLELAEN